ncbi:hypothetical protein QFC22_003199 [Naganishia vaughanmartiniae]|uniref:Uncharacterized protein n=1 Tax=Naganishia vaughanmartiniae TaxID=1424756 RepID=A0ACC2XAC6_9TREE|nr:hypothetical protein QFC22_003199 [Naganishia vaughanmartiniae]
MATHHLWDHLTVFISKPSTSTTLFLISRSSSTHCVGSTSRAQESDKTQKMSKPTQPPAATGGKPAARALTGSKWALGPPQLSQPASATVSPLQSPNPNKEKLTTSDSATTSTPPSARQSQAGQPRKAATPAAPAASKAVNIPSPPTAASTPAKNPALNFGTVDNPESTISSSPATKPTAGAHLGEGEKVKSFGSVAAAAAAQSPAVAVSTPAPTSDKPAQVNGDKPAPPTEAAAAPAPAQTKPKFDPHKMFQKAPAATPSSAPSAPTAAPVSPAAAAPIALASPAPVPQQQNPYAQLQATQMQPGQAGIPHSRGYTAQGMPVQSFSPSGGQQNGINNNQSRGGPHRSPIMNHSQPGQFNPASGAFSPASGPNIRPPRQSNQQQMGGRGMYAPQGMPGQHYPGMAQAFSPYGQGPYNAYEFNPAFQYQQQQHYPGQPGGPSVQSPSMGRPPLHNAHSGSFGSNTSGLPPVTGGVASPMSPQLAPGTPQQAPRTPSLFSPGAAAFSPGASAFTPGGGPPAFVPAKARASAVKITRDDGTAVDLSIVAKTVKGSGPTAAAIAAAASIAATASPKPTGAVPVTVRIESPVQKELRQRELDEEKKRKEQDAREERERKERKEKKEKDDQQREQKQAEEKKADDKVSLPA